MRLKRLEVIGFKSFAEPFRIDFGQGITCIVGPNGCGKSNVADALRWVLGNQSPKQLRADRMESVIFSGSSKRKQMGMAEVTLTFDNSDRLLGLDYDEVAVTRRLFRSGESEYSINGNRCRLMDITDLVVDRGLGSTGYWILESKMVATILSNRPEDRRFLFDEAAGIVKYKIQRHRAELKLNSAAGDLERLSDIIMEIESTCNGLKKQVRAYRRYEKVSGTVRALTEAMARIEAESLKLKLEGLKKELDETSAVVGRETAALSTKSTVLAEARVEFSKTQSELDRSHRKCSALDSKLASNDRELAVAAEKISSSDTRTAQNTARIARERERLYRYSSDTENMEAEKSVLVREMTELEEMYQAAGAELARIEQNLKEAAEEYESAKIARRKLRTMLEERQRVFREQVRREEARLQKLAAARKAAESLSEKKSVLEESESSMNDELQLLKKQAEVSESTLKRLQNEEAVLSKTISELNTRLSETDQAIAVLNEQVERVTKLRDGLSLDETVSSLIRPLNGMGRAVGAYLDSFNSARPVDSIAEALDAGDGRFAVEAVSRVPELPADAVSLADCVEKTESSLVTSILSHGLLAPDNDTAVRWLSEGISMTVVTADGAVFRPDGLIRLGVEESTAGVLELDAILADLREKLKRSVEIRESVSSALTEQVSKLREAKEKVTAAMNSIRLNENRLVAVQTSLKNVRGELGSTEKELTLLLEEMQRASVESESLNVPEEQMRVLERQLTEATHIEEQAAKKAAILRNAVNTAAREKESAGFRLRENKNRQKSLSDKIEMLKKEAESTEDLLAEIQEENEKASGNTTLLRKRIASLRKENEQLGTERGTAERERDDLSKERNRLMERTSSLEKELQLTRERLGKAKSRMIELEALVHSTQEQLGRTEAVSATENNPFLGRTRDELADELVSAKAALEKIGPVNMLAVTEYEEASGRLRYFLEQKEDLENARASLARAITQINTEAAQRFRETFEVVRNNFREMFVKLFGGGEGDIISIEGDDPLDGGIEIMARPKGKKLTNVIALSEGEKALTAVALLFSLYLVKPSPFCMLDELDSPFDDSNTDKFVDILREFSGQTQFIVITHNKRTMEGADVLHGITMAEEGVSTSTSVSLKDMVHKK